ncbi:hypothetical protein WG66_010660 [Moniliophthora roreri]|nr:hypothetical protein WG66_010660 [Moniliophthora roreri]
MDRVIVVNYRLFIIEVGTRHSHNLINDQNEGVSSSRLHYNAVGMPCLRLLGSPISPYT